MRRPLHRLLVPLVTSGLLVAGGATAASAHSLDSSTLSVQVAESAVQVRVSVALEALDAGRGTGYASAADLDSYASEVIAYLDEHLTVTGQDGRTWTESWSDPVRESVEGIASFSAEVVVDPAGADPSVFTLAYDAVIEADPTHEAVVVLTDRTGEISTAGVLTAGDSTLGVGTVEHGWIDMVGLGLHHVLQGADHLLFLALLMLVAPLTVVGNRWRARTSVVASLRAVLGVATAFTLGHSVTLIASALGWVSVPTAPVEVLVAASVGVSALHAIRPLVPYGEHLIAAGFGLVHGLAFAGILAGLGLQGSTSLSALLAFNVGVELAQLATIAVVLPPLVLAARTRYYPLLRGVVALAALLASCAWALERLGVSTDPLAAVEAAAVAHSSWLAAALAVVCVAAHAADRAAPGRRRRAQDSALG